MNAVLRRGLLCIAWLSASTSPAQTQAQGLSERSNAFNDPFFQLTAHVPDCPVPAGPHVTEREKREQAHGRAERGTTCWLSGACERANAYAYDRDIARATQALLLERTPAPRSSLWVTVQRRIVYLEGCVATERDGARLEALVKTVPDVDRAIAIVYVKPRRGVGRPPYKLLTAP